MNLQEVMAKYDDDLLFNTGQEEVERHSSYGNFQPSVLTVQPLRSVEKNFHLRLKKQVKYQCERRKLLASSSDILAFIRVYFHCSMARLDATYFFKNYNLMIWIWTLMTILKLLPITYVHMFYGKFSPHHHFLLSKMSRILYGVTIIKIMSAASVLIYIFHQYMSCLNRVILAVWRRGPWNRCHKELVLIENTLVRCYEISEYMEIINGKKNFSVTTQNTTPWFFINRNHTTETFTLSQLLFHEMETSNINKSYSTITLSAVLMFLTVFFTQDQIFKKTIWKIIKYVNVCQLIMYGSMWTHMALYLQHQDLSASCHDEDDYTFSSILKTNADIWLLSETLTCPPLIHVLTARNMNQMQPESASVVLVVMNSIYVFSVGRLTFIINSYLTHITYIDLNFHLEYAGSSESTTYPLYFSTFYFGELFYFIFLTCSLLAKALSIVIAVHIWFEAMVCEWKWLKKWWLMVVWSLVNVYQLVYNSLFLSELHLWYTFVNVLEMFTVIFVYPYKRLADDVLFKCGSSPTIVRTANYVLGFVCFSLSLSLTPLAVTATTMPYIYNYNITELLLPLTIIIILGAFYAFYKIIIVQKKKCWQLFIPVPNWGPHDYMLRSMRKQFNGSEFISSQAARNLSRHIMLRRNPRMYHLRVDYFSKMSSASEFLFINEKKTK